MNKSDVKIGGIRVAVITASLCGCILMIVYREETMNAVISGCSLWLRSVMPALFPFFVCTSFMQRFGILANAGGKLSILILTAVSAISGIPSGAQLTNALVAEGVINKEKLTPIAACANLVSPMFITGSLAAGMLGNINYALPIVIGHYLSSFIMIALCSVDRKGMTDKNAKPLFGKSLKTNGVSITKNLVQSIAEGVEAMLKVGGTIVFFLVVINITEAAGIFEIVLMPFELFLENTDCIKALLVGAAEMTNGCATLSTANGVSQYMVCAVSGFIISFGGICVLAQSKAFAQVNTMKYIMHKLIVGVLAAIITYFAAKLLLPDSSQVFSAGQSELNKAAINFGGAVVSCAASLIAVSTVWVLSVIQKRSKRLRGENA